MLRVVTPPDSPGLLLSLEEGKAQCRVDFDDDDALLTELCAGAGETVETDVQRLYLAQTLEWVCDTWPAGRSFPIAGVFGAQGMEVVSVTYIDVAGVEQTLDPSQYWAKAAGQTLKLVPRWFVFWPLLGDGAERVVIRFTVPGTPEDVPVGVKHACRLLVSHWYANRDAVVGVDNRDSSAELPLGFQTLLWRQYWSA